MASLALNKIFIKETQFSHVKKSLCCRDKTQLLSAQHWPNTMTVSPEVLDLSTVPLLCYVRRCYVFPETSKMENQVRSRTTCCLPNTTSLLPCVTLSLLSKATHSTGQPLGNSVKVLEGRWYADDLKSLGNMTLMAFTFLRLQLDRRNSSRCWIAQLDVSNKN